MLDTNLSNQPRSKSKISEGYMGKTLWYAFVLQFEGGFQLSYNRVKCWGRKKETVQQNPCITQIYLSTPHKRRWLVFESRWRHLRDHGKSPLFSVQVKSLGSSLYRKDVYFVWRLQHWRGRLRFQPRNAKNIQESAGRGWLPTRRWWRYIF